jgi:hypothetical protein
VLQRQNVRPEMTGFRPCRDSDWRIFDSGHRRFIASQQKRVIIAVKARHVRRNE